MELRWHVGGVLVEKGNHMRGHVMAAGTDPIGDFSKDMDRYYRGKRIGEHVMELLFVHLEYRHLRNPHILFLQHAASNSSSRVQNPYLSGQAVLGYRHLR